MRKSMNAFLILAIPLCTFACQWNKSIEPAFKDGGVTVRNLKDQWKCERIDFENWEEDDAQDSSLTICLINSNSVPNPRSDKSTAILKMIAAEVKQSLKYPGKYKSYHVIFVKEEGSGLSVVRVHTYGGDIQNSDL